MGKNTSGEPRVRNIWIDCLRGFCVLAVLCTHGLFQFPTSFVQQIGLPSSILDKGYFGVVTFFVISGYLITGNTLRRYGQTGSIDLGQFYAMRVARILPILLLFLTLMVLMAYSGIQMFTPPTKEMMWGSVSAALTLHYNTYYFTANAPGLAHWSPLWSLSIEELFYLTFPIACFLSRRTSVFAAMLALIVLCGPLVRNVFADVFNFWGAADLLALGGLTAIACDGSPRWLKRMGPGLLWIGGLGILAVFCVGDTRENFRLAPTLLGIATGVFLAGTSASGAPAWLTKLLSPLAAVGRVSYEIYVFHVTLIMVLMPALNPLLAAFKLPEFATKVIFALVVLAIIYGFCSLLSRYFTEPVNAAIRRFYAKAAA